MQLLAELRAIKQARASTRFGLDALKVLRALCVGSVPGIVLVAPPLNFARPDLNLPPPLNDTFVAVLCVAAALLFIALLSLIPSAALKSVLRRNEAVLEEFRSYSAGKILARDDFGPFTLYLRPFAVDVAPIPFSRLVCDALDDLAPPIMLGNAGSLDAPVNVPSTDENWREQFARLADAATMIICVPLASTSTLIEITHLRELSLLHKTIFLIPPKTAIDGARDTENWYEQSRVVLEQQGVTMPASENVGVMFSLMRDGRPFLMRNVPAHQSQFLGEAAQLLPEVSALMDWRHLPQRSLKHEGYTP